MQGDRFSRQGTSWFYRFKEALLFIVIGAFFIAWAIGQYLDGFTYAAFYLSFFAAIFIFLSIGAIERGRLTSRRVREGFLEIIEGELRFFGPHGGHIIAIEDLTRISLTFDHCEEDRAYWVLEHRLGAPIFLPKGTRGEAAFNNFLLSLPGVELPSGDIEKFKPVATIVWTRSTTPRGS